MTVQTTSSKAGPFLGNGATLVWSSGFRIDQPADLWVIYTDPTGVEAQLDATLYTATGFGDPDGVSVTYPISGTPISAAEKITLLRVVNYDQQTSITNQGGFYPKVIEAALDRIVYQTQQIAEKLGRAITLSASSALSGLFLPDPESGKYLRGRADGAGYENAELASSAVIGIPVSIAQGGTGQTTLAAYAADVSTQLGLGTAATRNAGAAAGNVVQLDGSAQLPALDARNLTNIDSTKITDPGPLAISGLLPSGIAGSNTTAALATSPGRAIDSTGSKLIKAPAVLNWAVANGNAINGFEGGMTLPNSSTIHFYLCSGANGVGIFGSTSLTPAAPAGYMTFFRRIVSLLTDSSGALIGGTAVEIFGGGYEFIFSASQQIFTGTVPTTAALISAAAPAGFKSNVILDARMSTTAAVAVQVRISSPDSPDETPSNTNGNLATGSGTAPMSTAGQLTILVNTSNQIRHRSSSTSQSGTYQQTAYTDFRRN